MEYVDHGVERLYSSKPLQNPKQKRYCEVVRVDTTWWTVLFTSHNHIHLSDFPAWHFHVQRNDKEARGHASLGQYRIRFARQLLVTYVSSIMQVAACASAPSSHSLLKFLPGEMLTQKSEH
eukprot:2500228-Amphidinium_carterae.1